MKKALIKSILLQLTALLLIVLIPIAVWGQDQNNAWYDKTISIKALLSILGIPTAISIYSFWKYYKETNKSIGEKAKEVVQAEFAQQINLHKRLLLQLWEKEGMESRILKEKKIIVIGESEKKIEEFIKEKTIPTPLKQNNLIPSPHDSKNPFAVKEDLALFCFDFGTVKDETGKFIPSKEGTQAIEVVKSFINHPDNSNKYFIWFVKGQTNYYDDRLTYANTPATLFGRVMEIMKFMEMKND